MLGKGHSLFGKVALISTLPILADINEVTFSVYHLSEVRINVEPLNPSGKSSLPWYY